MVTAKEVTTSVVHGKLRKVQRIYEGSGEAMTTTVIKVIKLASDLIEARSKNANLSERLQTCRPKCQPESAESQMTFLNRELAGKAVKSEKRFAAANIKLKGGRKNVHLLLISG